jgi:hypothetical protein
LPLLVVLPETAAQVKLVVRYCHEERIKVVPRGSGTSLSAGALPLEDGVLLVTARMNRILEVDGLTPIVDDIYAGTTITGIVIPVHGHALDFRAESARDKSPIGFVPRHIGTRQNAPHSNGPPTPRTRRVDEDNPSWLTVVCTEN